MSDLEVSCPCCNSKLVIDAKSGRVITTIAPKEKGMSLEEFINTEDKRKQEIDDMFEAGRKNEETKKEFLNKKFEWAKKNQDKLPNLPDRKIFWD